MIINTVYDWALVTSLPNLFIPGFPKAGTTSLAQALGSHPEIFLPAEKEPHFFGNPTGKKCSEGRMHDLYMHAIEKEKYKLDASVWYLFSRDAIASIERSIPNAKYIVIVRNPVQQAFSLHAQMLITGTEHTRSFWAAWQLGEKRSSGIPVGMSKSKHVDPAHLAYSRSCAPCWQLRNLLEQVAPDRVKVIVFDDLKSNWPGVRREIARYLHISEPDLGDLPHANPRKQIRNMRLHKFLISGGRLKARLKIPFNFRVASKLRIANLKTGKSVLEKSRRNELEKYFAQEIDSLEKLLDRDFSRWR